MRRALQASVVAVLALAASAAGGETIFRCGDSYSLTPCANARVLEAVAPPSAAQRAEARAVAAREKQLALEMVRDREERERAIRPAAAGSLGPSHAAHAASAPGKTKKQARAKKRAASGEDGRDFVAAVPKAKP